MEKKKFEQYTHQQVTDAIQDVRYGISINKAAIKHGISRTTLQRKLKGETSDLSTKMGPGTIFSEDQENVIIKWIKATAKAGFPISKETLMCSVGKLAQELGLLFGANIMPGRKWYASFRRRHPEIADRASQNLTVQRRAVNQENISGWFHEVWNYIKDNKLEPVFEDPKRVFNCDETAFFLNPKPGKVLAEKGAKNVYTSAGADEKYNLTVLLTANAAGQLAPPMIVYRYMRIPPAIAASMPETWAIGKSENGWMTQETFYEFMTNIFEPWLTKENIPRPVVFFLDGHTSHLSLPLRHFCKEKQIELVALFPNATHLLQPMDVAVFRSLKASWRQKVGEWRMAHDGAQVEKHQFPVVLKGALESISPSSIQNGFKACGLLPWNPSAVRVSSVSSSTTTSKTSMGKPSDNNIFLKVLEEKIGTTKLMQFSDNTGTWKGDVADQSLYEIWLETKTMISQSLGEQEVHEMVPDIADEATTTESTNQQAEAVPGPSGLSSGLSMMAELKTTGKSHSPSEVPSPFKRALFWPGESSGKKSKRARREKLPAVVTSPQMLEYYKKKEAMKKTKAEELEKKKLIRLQKKQEAEEKKKAKERKPPSPSSSSPSSPSYAESDNSPLGIRLFSETESSESGMELSEMAKEGDFLLVKFVGGKRNTTTFKYLCVLQEQVRNEETKKVEHFKVQALRSYDDTKKVFVLIDNDVSHILPSQVESVVPTPEIKMEGRGLLHIFKKKLCVVEK